MKSLLLLLSFFLFASCVETNYPTSVAKPDPTFPVPVSPTEEAPLNEFSRYIEVFEARNLMAGGHPNPDYLQVVFAEQDELPYNVLGTCSINEATVKIHREWWDKLTPDHREELIFHELGHCVLGREHEDRLDEFGFPISVMNSKHMGSGLYRRFGPAYQNYMSELFGTNDPLVFAQINYNENNYTSKTYSNASTYVPSKSTSGKEPSLAEITCANH